MAKKEYTEAYHVVNRGMDIRQSPLLFYELGEVNYLRNLLKMLLSTWKSV